MTGLRCSTRRAFQSMVSTADHDGNAGSGSLRHYLQLRGLVIFRRTASGGGFIRHRLALLESPHARLAGRLLDRCRPFWQLVAGRVQVVL